MPCGQTKKEFDINQALFGRLPMLLLSQLLTVTNASVGYVPMLPHCAKEKSLSDLKIFNNGAKMALNLSQNFLITFRQFIQKIGPKSLKKG